MGRTKQSNFPKYTPLASSYLLSSQVPSSSFLIASLRRLLMKLQVSAKLSGLNGEQKICKEILREKLNGNHFQGPRASQSPLSTVTVNAMFGTVPYRFRSRSSNRNLNTILLPDGQKPTSRGMPYILAKYRTSSKFLFLG